MCNKTSSFRKQSHKQTNKKNYSGCFSYDSLNTDVLLKDIQA